MKTIFFTVFLFVTFFSFSQEEEFIPIDIEGKEAYMSTKTGEYTYLEHAKTDPTLLKTTASGVVYTDISNHTITKGETLSAIAKKNGVTVSEIKKHNKVTSSNLKIGTTLKIVKKLLIKSSSPVISYAGEERIIAKLRPGETPGQFAAPPSIDAVESKVIETKKTEEKAAAKTYKVDDTNIKNPVFGLGDDSETIDTDAVEGEIEGLLKEVNEDAKEVEKKEDVEVKKTSNQALTRVAKAEKLKQIRAEAKRLEAELEASPEVEIEEEIETKIEVKETSKPIKGQTEAPVLKVKPTETVAEKAARLVKSTKKTQAEMIAEKEKEKAAVVEAFLKKEIAAEKKVEVEEEEEEVEEVEENGKTEYFHTVKKGESFYSIAMKYNMSTEALMLLNKAKSANLDIGQKVIIKKPKN